MKKLLFVFAAFVAICFASCTTKCTCDNQSEEDTTVVDTAVMDTLSVDSCEEVC